MPQPHRQCRVKALDRPVKGDRHYLAFRFERVLTVAVELRWGDRLAPVIRVLPHHQAVSDQFLHRRVQQQVLLAGVGDLLPLQHEELVGQGDSIRQRTEAAGFILDRVDLRERCGTAADPILPYGYLR